MVSKRGKTILKRILILLFLVSAEAYATNYYQCSTYYCQVKTGTSSACSGTPTTCSATQYCSGNDVCSTGLSKCSTGSCDKCGKCSGSGDSCGAVTCGTQTSTSPNGACSGTNYCDGTGATSAACKAKGGTGAACGCNGACLSNVCTGGHCAALYASDASKCGYYTGTTVGCSSTNTFCGPGNYLGTTQACGTGALSCSSETSANSCDVCGDCATGAATCNTIGCGNSSSYGCSNMCTGGGKGASYCIAASSLTFGTACLCGGVCQSGVCTTGTCAGYYANTASFCGFYFGTSASCTSNSITNCDSTHYFPTVACTTTKTTPTCTAVSSSASCAVCGTCSSNSCNAIGCGNTSSYGCSNMCTGAGTGAAYCITAASLSLGASCLCSAVCQSGICSSTQCQTYRGSGTHLCGYYSGTSATCNSATANGFCSAGQYYPTQACGLSTSAPSCSSESSSASCDVCGDCHGSGLDQCDAVACGTTNSFGCSNMCKGGGTGAAYCITAASLDNGASCLCDQVCQSGVCTNNVCTAPASPAFITVTLNYPNDDVWNTTTNTITHYYTPVITGTSADYLNCTLYTNHTGTWGSIAGNATPVTNNVINSIQYTYPADNANVKWNIYCWNLTGSSFYNYSATNRTIKIDTVAPTTTPSSSYSFGTWTGSSSVSVTLSCSDATSGCAGGYPKYCADNTPGSPCTPTTTYTGAVSISTEGLSFIRYYSVDSAGNTESTKNKSIMIDTTAPATTALAVKNDSTSYSFNAWTSSTYVNVTLSCADTGGSGCSTTKYCTASTDDCTPGTAYTTPVQISTEGTSYIRYNSTDAVGNNEAVESQTIKIDTTGPTPVQNLTNSSTGITWVNITWDASTDTGGSGVNTYLIWRNGTNVANTTDLYYNNSGLSAGATYVYDVGAIDNVGNYGDNSSDLTVSLFNTSTNLVQSAAPASPQAPSTNVTFSCNYSNSGDNSAITDATVYLNLNGVNYSATYDPSSTNYTYWNNSMPTGANSWYCLASETGYQSQTGVLQGYDISLGVTLTTDATSYTSCGAVFYRVSLYDKNSQLTSSSFSLTFIYPNSTNATPPLSLYPNNGTGIYTGSYSLSSTSPLGVWLMKVIESFGATAGKNFYVVAAS